MVRSALDQISDFVNAAAIEGGFTGDDAHLNRVRLTLDERGWQDVSRKLTDLLGALAKIQETSQKRLDRANHRGARDVTVVTMGFETAEPMIARRRSRQPASTRPKTQSGK